MEKKGKRPYHSPERAERQDATRREILRAAEALFAGDGYAAVTMKAIAAAAGVAPATLYLHFPGKAAIVEAMARAITGASDLSVELVEGEPSVEEQLRIGASILRRLNERAWLVTEILRSQAGAEPELAALRTDWERRHLDAVTRGVSSLASAGKLRPGLDVATAADIMYAIGGTDVFRALVKERGWSPDAYESWLASFGQQQLL